MQIANISRFIPRLPRIFSPNVSTATASVRGSNQDFFLLSDLESIQALFRGYVAIGATIVRTGVRASVLAVRTEVGAAAGDENSANGSAADQTRLAGAEIDLVFQLEKALLSGSIHIIGDGRAT